jgi:hypothetical protein
MKRIYMKSFLVLSMTTALIFSALPVMAEDKAADNMQIVLEKVRADKKLIVAQNMQLTEAEAKAFWPIYEEYQEGLVALFERMRRLIEDYGTNFANMSDDRAGKLLDDYLAIEKEDAVLMESFLIKLRKILPEKKVMRYFQIENKIKAAVDYELARNIPLVK